MRFAGAKTNQIQFDGFNPSGRGGESIGAAARLSTMPATYAALSKSRWKPASVAAHGVKGYGDYLNASRRAGAAVDIARNKARVTKAKTKATVDYYNKKATQASNQGWASTAIGAGLGIAKLAIGLSDITTKNTVETIEDSLTTLRNLRPVSFYYNKEYSLQPELKHYGFVAQEYQKHMPDATYTEKSTGKLCIDTSELIALLVGAIQTLEGRIRRLEVKSVLEPVVSGKA